MSLPGLLLLPGYAVIAGSPGFWRRGGDRSVQRVREVDSDDIASQCHACRRWGHPAPASPCIRRMIELAGRATGPDLHPIRRDRTEDNGRVRLCFIPSDIFFASYFRALRKCIEPGGYRTRLHVYLLKCCALIEGPFQPPGRVD